MKTVLIVDDSSFMRLVLKNILTQNGYKVIGEADNGVDAINKYIENEPNIVTMDITMPVLNGVDASKKILGINPNANILIVSALCQKSYVIDLLESGIKDYILKPIKPDVFLAAINAIS